MTAEIPSAEIAMHLRRQEPRETGCVLGREECPHCWPCRLEAAARAKREARRERVARFRTLLRLRAAP